MTFFPITAWGIRGVKLGIAATLGLVIGAPMALADEAQARAILKGMTDYLAAQESLSFDVDSSVDVVTTDDQRLTIASSGSIAMQRPDKLRVLRRGGFATIEIVFDGKTLSVWNREANVYGEADLPGTIDSLIDSLRDTYQRPLPAADLLGSNAEKHLLADVTAVTDLGSGIIRGQECDHLAFRSAEVDWQVWIAQGAVPHPCRFIITSKTMTGWPEYRLEFSAWGKGAVEPDFATGPLAGQTKVDIADIPDLDEVAGIFVIREGN